MSIKMSWYMFRVNSSMKPLPNRRLQRRFTCVRIGNVFTDLMIFGVVFITIGTILIFFCYLTKYAITLTRSIYYLFQDAALSKLFGISKVIGSQITYF